MNTVRQTGPLLVLGMLGCGRATPTLVTNREAPPIVGGTQPVAAALAAGPVVPALADRGPHAFVVDDRGLVEVAASGQTQVVSKTPPRWCAADARAQVVWFASESGLSTFDLTDRRVHPVVVGEIETREFSIDYGDQHLGVYSEVDYRVALALHLTRPPRVGALVGCEGDAMVYCYDDIETKKLRPEYATLHAQLEAMKLADPAYVAALVDRGAGRSLWPPRPQPAKVTRKPVVDRKACTEDATRCGELTAVPASPLWLVTTGNSRGDFYHEDRDLWDPATGEFLAVTAKGALVRSKKPPTNGDYAELRVSLDGVLSTAGLVFDATHVIYAPTGDWTRTCGWSSGWRIAGVRGDMGN